MSPHCVTVLLAQSPLLRLLTCILKWSFISPPQDKPPKNWRHVVLLKKDSASTDNLTAFPLSLAHWPTSQLITSHTPCHRRTTARHSPDRSVHCCHARLFLAQTSRGDAFRCCDVSTVSSASLTIAGGNNATTVHRESPRAGRYPTRRRSHGPGTAAFHEPATNRLWSRDDSGAWEYYDCNDACVRMSSACKSMN